MRQILVGLGLAAALLAPAAGAGLPAPAATLEVCASGCAYATIQAAVNAAQPGDTVLVHPGTYAEQVGWSKDRITLASRDGAAATTIDASNEPGDRGTAVAFFGSGNALRGFTLRAGLAAEFSFGVFFGYGDGNTIEDNVVDRAWVGIEPFASSRNVVKGNTVTGTTFFAIGECCGLDGNRYEDNTLTGNRVAFYVSSEGTRIVYNRIHDNSAGMGCEGPVDARYNYWGTPLGPQLGSVVEIVLEVGANGACLDAEATPWCAVGDCADMRALVGAGVLPP